MNPVHQDLLRKGVKQFGLDLEPEAFEAFEVFLDELLKWNRRINLTAIRTEEGIVIRHFLDSLSLFPYLSAGCSVLDMGSGAGFPGIPLKIAVPSLRVTLVDATLKKVHFQRHILRKLGLKEIEALHGRVEDKRFQERIREKYDFTVSRAFSDLKPFLHESYPYLKRGGIAVAMKGTVLGSEIRSLSGEEDDRFRLNRMDALTLPFAPLRRTVLLFQKR